MYRTVNFLLILLCISTNALAASGSLSYSGTVGTTCSFSNIVNGTLGVSPSSPTVLWTNGPGTPASLDITYLGTPTMSVEDVSSFTTKPNGVSDSDFSYSMAVGSNQGASYSLSNGYYTHTYSTGNSDNLTVNFAASKSNGGNVPLGNYATTSIITCQ